MAEPDDRPQDRRALARALDELERLLEDDPGRMQPGGELPILTDVIFGPELAPPARPDAAAARREALGRLEAAIERHVESRVAALAAALGHPGANTPDGPEPTRSDPETRMEKTYDPHAIEGPLYERWEAEGCFTADAAARPGTEPFCIMLPPPNVTGSLHMGHAFQDTLMDTLVRWHRMRGDPTLWQCGTDHAGIATQMVVERRLEAEGRSRQALGREAFVEAVWQWKAESGGTITRQLRRMGSSMDWSRERFTLDEGLSAAVTEVFVTLFDEGLIHRGKRLVNWDPVLKTAISDLEVISEEEAGSLWHFRYPFADDPDGPGGLVVATTRPETMLGDVAVAVHPDDERYRDLVGRSLLLPLTGRTIPVIADDYVDPEFGSGCVKITPAHDFNDYAVGQRHNLALINVFTRDAALNDNVPEAYRGMDRFEARKALVADLDAAGLLVRVDEHRLMVPRGDRSGAVVEPFLTDQWFVRTKPLAEPAIRAVKQGHIRFVPEHRAKTYFEWMYNIEDWCISRQLWWGHRIPAWYTPDGRVLVGRSEAQVRERHGIDADVTLSRDPDVLDTWFSSALWPFSTLGWPERTPELETFYPTSVLITGHDIIFFWVARMIMMGLKFMDDVPFREVYVHGLVRDADGNKMSKSKGNVLDPIDLIDGIDLETLVAKRTSGLMRPQDAARIEKATRRQFPDGIPSYGTDALRFTFAALATQGLDVKFDLGRIEGYRNFCNKIWNSARFALMVTEDESVALELADDDDLHVADRWILARLDALIEQVDAAYRGYRFDLAAQAMHRFVWEDYCDWYLEAAKSRLSDETLSAEDKAMTRRVLLEVMEHWLRVLHPVMPFITDALWTRVAPRLGIDGATVMLAHYPEARFEDRLAAAEVEFGWLQAFVSGVRRIRAERDIDPKKPLPVVTIGGADDEKIWTERHAGLIRQLARVTEITRHTGGEFPDGATALAGDTTLLVPLAEMIDPEAEQFRLTRELERLAGDRKRVESKLANENFVTRAPAAVVDKERARLAEIDSAIARYQEQLERVRALR